MDRRGDDIHRLSPGIVVLWMLDTPGGPTVVLMLSALGVSALFRRQNEGHDTAGQALPEFESPTPAKTGGLKTERVSKTIPPGPPCKLSSKFQFFNVHRQAVDLIGIFSISS